MTINVVEFFQSLQSGFFDFFFNMISFLGEQYVYILILGIVYYAYNKKLGEYLAFTLFFTGLFNNTLKLLVNAQRPFQKYPDRVNNLRPETSTGHSFPSGHVQNFTAFLFAEGFYVKKVRFFVVASVLAALMAISRMYLGVHFLEDVLVSIILGILTAYAFSKFFFKLDDKKLHILYIITITIFTPFVFLLGEEDLFKAYGLMIGLLGAMMFEKKYVKFTMDVSLIKKVIRVVSGLVVMLSIQLGLGVLFDMLASEGSMLLFALDAIRYGLVAFIGLGVYPILFKKFNF
ncbi:undecaprenyl pyrophosphate phosphatase [Candidatus Izimaplasma bacterium HR1]|jgi:membrane-associated phospholipid phosphatase|uniref:phosphatase PAP2 family protein n=1 Tax=Candidatus Izimoplasma sp. HR1 TaxID=1541959 RepID=UPI0004F6FAB2|nr:undecaprenyl pyrophosphate phosphatase [Candidatus Izimaplasma bacterium HR1]